MCTRCGSACACALRCAAERLSTLPQARITRDFRKADGIRDQLRQMGIEIDDKQKTWCAMRKEWVRRAALHKA